MLNKKVCEACWNTSTNKFRTVWNEIHDIEWMDGLVGCPPEIDGYSSVWIRIGDYPPDHCPKKLEHLVFNDA